MDLLNKMDIFYNNSWTRLIWVVTISFAIIGVFVPILVQWYQKRELKLSEDKLKKDIHTEFEKALLELKEKIEKENELQLKKLRAELRGSFYITQANIFATQNYPNKAVYHFMQALSNSFLAGKKANVSNIFEPLIFNIEDSNKLDIDNTFEHHDTTFFDFLNKIKKYDAETVFKSRFNAVEMHIKTWLKLFQITRRQRMIRSV